MTSISNTARRLLLTSTSAATSRSCLRANPNTSSSAVLRAAAFSSSSSSSSSKSATTRALLSQRLSRRQQINSNNAPLLLRDGNGKRWSSISATGSKIWTFEEIQTLSSSPSSSSPKKPVLIDVREPGELASTGRIPGAINIPITTSPDSFHLSPADFEDRFGFAPPDKEGDELVLYCKAGVRSRAAAGLAREAGFKNVGEYPGSWIEWSGKGGEVER